MPYRFKMQWSPPCNRRYSMRRHITAPIIVCFISGVTVLVLESLLPGFAIEGWQANIGVVLAFGITPAIAWLFVFRLADPDVGKEPTAGAVQLHATMKGWRDQLQRESGGDSVVGTKE